MPYAAQSTAMFRHPAVVDGAVRGRALCVQVTKSTRIWAGGLSTAGGAIRA